MHTIKSTNLTKNYQSSDYVMNKSRSYRWNDLIHKNQMICTRLNIFLTWKYGKVTSQNILFLVINIHLKCPYSKTKQFTNEITGVKTKAEIYRIHEMVLQTSCKNDIIGSKKASFETSRRMKQVLQFKSSQFFKLNTEYLPVSSTPQNTLSV